MLEPLAYFLGETKVIFESDVLPSLAVVTPLSHVQAHTNKNVALQKVSHRQVRQQW